MKVYVYIVPRTNLTKKKKRKKVAGKREVRIIAYTSKNKKQRTPPSRIEEETLLRPSLSRSQMKCDAMQRVKKKRFESTEG